ncbi:MAG: cellulase family glycosylhydrolase [Spirochaetales bacterium]|nr:cellulase family glycosylhydrolase [Spirochaetales bacterium]
MITTNDAWLRDEHGRALILRGCNLGGDCKQPYWPANELAQRERFYDYKAASFVGRPFPDAEADEHLDRLARWGFNVVRLLVTWEGLEPAGPGLYDEAYYDYIERVVAKAAERGIRVFVDPHQDVWSRWTGGDGAPAWTLELAGFDIRNLHASGAAFVHEEAGDPCPRMIWPSNYNRLATATMFTLFFAGDLFAPSLRMDGRDARTFLQGSYLAAVARLAKRLARHDAVMGFDTLNEPGDGWIGWSDASRLVRAMSKTGPMPTPWESMRAASGYPVDVDVYGVRWGAQRPVGRATLGQSGLSAWASGRDCVWKREGVWDDQDGSPVLKKPGHFASAGGKAVEFERDCLRPFACRVGAAMADAAGTGRYLLFVESVPNVEHPRWEPDDAAEARAAGIVNASHWYDGLTLTLKRWTGFLGYDTEAGRIVVGPGRLRRYFAEHLGRLRSRGAADMGGAPTVVGEFGLPFDLNKARAYRTGDYRLHEKAMAAYYDALDANLLSGTVWNYAAGNTHARGDGWNGEDLSIFCRDERDAGRSETGESADSGGRALRGFARPYARAVAGTPLSMRWSGSSFWLAYAPGPDLSAETEIFLPGFQFPSGFSAEVENGAQRAEDVPGGVILLIRADAQDAPVRVTVRRNRPAWTCPLARLRRARRSGTMRP